MRDQELLNEAVRRGLLRQDQVSQIERSLSDIAAKGRSICVPDLLVMKGFLTRAQVDAIRRGAAPSSAQASFGSYQIVRKIGEGAMGVVYLAYAENAPRRPVALKVLHTRSNTDEDSNLRIKREAEILVRMKHPNIVQGYEFGEFKGRFYIAMEYLEGRPLDELVRDRGPLPEKTGLKVGLDIARALEFMQSENLVHRDIKPGNIMIQETCAKLMDLGLAKAAGKDAMQLTAPGMAIGTPVYMSTEQLKGERHLDVRTDIYSLGATLFYAVSGVKPFDGEKPSDIIAKKLERPVPSVRAKKRDLSDHIEQLLWVMMSKAREDRHPTPAELVSDIQRILEGNRPVREPRKKSARTMMLLREEFLQAAEEEKRRVAGPVAPPPPPPPPTRKRRPWIMVGAALVVVAALAAFAVLQWQGIDLFALFERK